MEGSMGKPLALQTEEPEFDSANPQKPNAGEIEVRFLESASLA